MRQIEGQYSMEEKVLITQELKESFFEGAMFYHYGVYKNVNDVSQTNYIFQWLNLIFVTCCSLKLI